MGILIQDPTIGKQAEELAERHGISVEEAIGIALREKLEREATKPLSLPPCRKGTMEEALEIIKHYQSLPLYDHRSADEILGYNKYGVWE